MLINSMLSPARTCAKIKGASKKRVLQNLAKLFAETTDNMNADDLFQSLLNRERLGSTGIGEGIAIPHCRFDTGGKTYAACLSLAEPIDFDSIDSKPVDIIFAMLVPENAEQGHLQALASLAETLQTDGFVSALRAANSDLELFDVVTGN